MTQWGQERVWGMLSLTSKDKVSHIFRELWVSSHCPGHVQALKTNCLTGSQQERTGRWEKEVTV